MQHKYLNGFSSETLPLYKSLTYLVNQKTVHYSLMLTWFFLRAMTRFVMRPNGIPS